MRANGGCFLTVFVQSNSKLSSAAGLATISSSQPMTTNTNASLASSPSQRWLLHGQLALNQGKPDEALQAFRKAAEADPKNTDALMWLAGHCDDPRESLRHFTRVLSQNPRHAGAHAGIRWARKRLLASGGAPKLADVYIEAAGQLQTTMKPRRSPAPLSMRIAQWTIVVCLVIAVLLSVAIVWVLQMPVQTVEANVPTSVIIAQPEQPTPEAAESEAPAPTLPTPTYAERADKIMSAVDAAWAREDWDQAAPLIAQAMAFRPDDAALQRKLFAAYFNRAVGLIDDGDLERALASFDQALEVIPGEPQAVAERNTLANYIAGLEQFNQRNWAAAAVMLVKVTSADAGYLDARELLYRSYYNQGLELKQGKDLAGALKAFQSAVGLDASAVEARGELAQVKVLLTPPTPTPAPEATGAKWIDINLTTQRFRAMQGQTAVYTFATSTGEPGRPTQPGRYQILDKIPNAYSRFWNLWMPYWMGIYWAGASENGIHALPILSNGQKLWAGFLGRRVSFGCVILDTSAAKLMFDWAEIGTPVIIHY
jgi:tetratricopeptide (TPR) repeat protein